MDLRYLDRKRWVLLFDILAQKALQNPVSIEELYQEVLRQSQRLSLEISLQELKDIIKEFEERGIVKTFRDNKGNTVVVLTEEARYFVLIYSTSFIGL